MTLILLFLAGSLAAAILKRRGGRMTWLVAAAFAGLAWLTSLLQGRGLPRTWSVGQWGFLSGAAARLEFTYADVEWRLAVFVATLFLVLMLLEPSRRRGPDASSRMGLFIYAAVSVAALSAGTTLTMALSLPVLDVLSRWLTGRGPAMGGRWFEDRWALRFDGTAIVLLAVAVAVGGPQAWPSPGLIFAAFALRIAGAFSSWWTRPAPVGSAEGVLVLVVPIAVALKLMAETIRSNGMEPLPGWTVGLAVLAGSYALLRSSAQPVRLGLGSLIVAVGSMALAAGLQGGVAAMATLGWLGAVTVLSAGAVFMIEIHGLEDRFWAASALSLLFFLPLVGMHSLPGTGMTAAWAAIPIAIALAAVALWAVFILRLAEPATEESSPDMPARMIARLGFAFPAVVGIGLGVRSASIPSALGLAVSALALGIGSLLARMARRRVAARRTRWERAVEWIDLSAAARLLVHGGGVAGRAVHGLAGLFEGGSGILWAWALLLVLLLLGGGQV